MTLSAVFPPEVSRFRFAFLRHKGPAPSVEPHLDLSHRSIQPMRSESWFAGRVGWISSFCIARTTASADSRRFR